MVGARERGRKGDRRGLYTGFLMTDEVILTINS